MESASAGARPPQQSRAGLARSVTPLVVVLVLVLNLAQQPGLVTFDTKLDLQLNVTGFLSRSLDVWNGDWTLGGLQNQASGYLFPMGPAFWLGEALGVPVWIWERLWSAAVMLLAFCGMRRLASCWPGIDTAGAVVAGLAYMLSPRVLTTVGGLSGETLPSAVLPWTILPLVLYLRGRLRAPAAFLLSAATIPWMGGQNATLVVACLVLPGLLLLLAAGRPVAHRVRDSAAWTGFALAACLWWMVPLVLMGAYAPPFLGFIESAYNTASQTGWLSSLRGTNHWVAFIPGGGTAGWVGGYELASSSVLVFSTVLVAGAGLLGLAERGLWARRTLVVSVLVGLAVLTMGSPEPSGSVLGQEWLAALDGVLAPLRNVHKFDPLVRLPLCLGLGAFVATGLPRLAQRVRRIPDRRRPWAVAGLTGVLVVLVGAAAQPAASGDLRTADGAAAISAPWQQAADYLRAQDGPVGVLVLPGSGFAVQSWGRTVDEPIQVLGAPPWVSRSQSIVSTAGTLRVLDAVENQVAAGRPINRFASALNRLGITHVVVRNDLDADQSSAPPAEVVRAAVAGTSGLVPVAEFGRTAEGLPAVEVLALSGDLDRRVTLTAWEERAVVRGGPEVVVDLAQHGLVTDGSAVVLAGDDDTQLDVVTDSNQRVERSFGRITDAVSGVMTAEEPFRLRRPVHDFTGGSVPTATTVAEYDGVSRITASSSGGYANVLGPVRREDHPYAAFDRSAFTTWATAPLTGAVGQWIEVGFDDPVDPGPVALLFDNIRGADVARVRLTTGAGSVDVGVGTDGVVDQADLPPGDTSSLRITVLEVRPGARQVRLANVALAGVEVRRSLRVPGPVSAGTSMFFSAEPSRRACVRSGRGVACDANWQRETPETLGFDRTVTIAEGGSWQVAGRVVATNGAELERLFAPLDGNLVRVEPTSTYAGDPAVVGARAFDGAARTTWLASPRDATPGLQLSWERERTITSVRALLRAGQPGVLPEALVVDPLVEGEAPQLVATTGDDAGVMEPIRTDRLRISALADAERTSAVGIGELKIGGLAALRHPFDPRTPTGALCGFGPTVEVGGTSVTTRIVGTLRDVVNGAELELESCGRREVPLGTGDQRIRVTNPTGFSVSHLWLEPVGSSSPDATVAAVPDAPEVLSWTSTERRVSVSSVEEAVLSVAQSSNPGWEATLDGTRLEPVVVDGWRQGWLVPSETSGEVTLEFVPQRTFRWGIVLGLALAGLLILGAALVLVVLVVPARRWPRRWRRAVSDRERTMRVRGSTDDAADSASGRRSADTSAPRWIVALGAGALALVSLPLGTGVLVGHATRRLPLVPLSAACATGLLVAAAATVVEGSVITSPVVADVLVAAVVGVIGGRVLLGGEVHEGDDA